MQWNNRITFTPAESILTELRRADRARGEIINGTSDLLAEGEDPSGYFAVLSAVDVNQNFALLRIVLDMLGVPSSAMDTSIAPTIENPLAANAGLVAVVAAMLGVIILLDWWLR